MIVFSREAMKRINAILDDGDEVILRKEPGKKRLSIFRFIKRTAYQQPLVETEN